ncbi:MAG: hypothetical protein ABMA14_24635, partial [Hyphomonadaceae bacterium]
PLEAMLETADGKISVRQLIDQRPAVLALWATWCGPCLIEKAGEGQMARRLAEAGARTRILLIQAYDDKPLDEAVALLKRIGATDLPSVRATPAAEKLFLDYFGASSPTSARPFMPSIMLADSDGTELGRAAGMMRTKKLRKDYWYDDATFEFLSRL